MSKVVDCPTCAQGRRIKGIVRALPFARNAAVLTIVAQAPF